MVSKLVYAWHAWTVFLTLMSPISRINNVWFLNICGNLKNNNLYQEFKFVQLQFFCFFICFLSLNPSAWLESQIKKVGIKWLKLDSSFRNIQLADRTFNEININHNFISQMSELKRKDSGLVSTHFSKNQSACESGFFDAEMRKSSILQYSHIPMAKELPRWTQSAATWRHTSHRYSFSKDKRFKDARLNHSDILEPELPSTNNFKSCTFGKGTRKPISQVVLRNAKEKPASNAYDMNSFNQSPRSARYGKTFGIGWNNYQRVHIPHRKDVYSGHFNQDNPPAHYQVRQVPGKHKRAFSTYGRLKMFTQKMAEITRGNPGAHHNIKDRHLQNTVGLHDRNFGFGQRKDLSAPANDHPAAIYLIPGFCDKFKNTKRKAVGQNINK